MEQHLGVGGFAASRGGIVAHGVDVDIAPTMLHRNRLTCAFRAILVLPHVILVGGPVGLTLSSTWWTGPHLSSVWGVTTGVLGGVAAVCAIIAWFAIVFGGAYPAGLRDLSIFYLRWRLRAVAYAALLRDEYPPFGDGAYPASLTLSTPVGERNRLTVALRLLLAIPHVIAVWALSLVWCFTTVIAWLSILLAGEYPPALYRFAVGVVRWSIRVEAYLLLLDDAYPPFSLD